MGFPRQEYWSGLLFSSTGDLPDPGMELGSPALQADSLLSEPPGKSKRTVKMQDLKVCGLGIDKKTKRKNNLEKYKYIYLNCI